MFKERIGGGGGVGINQLRVGDSEILALGKLRELPHDFFIIIIIIIFLNSPFNLPLRLPPLLALVNEYSLHDGVEEADWLEHFYF